ncbi:phosphatase 2C-like domain-containing protein [Gamsiella multidivaricata]|uniref:phosphatase 2C-like domain-containing protein n=1 Tax=Gamsiella multidivaricata TaxID=101098 RepID=UPI00221FA8B5|nr:phosphatase 2C-like domain-containing protein [Gamsiella multidivaricata]KAI7831373.1 phosphatase 2C-like domain-containing protein [Gamsiella multidivaricata]
MLGRNVARPLGMSPSRIATAYNAMTSHRLTQWMLSSRPYSMLMHRYLFLAPQLLLTSSPAGLPNSTPTLVSLDGGVAVAQASSPSSSTCSSSSSSCQLHTSAATASLAQVQAQLAQEILLPLELHTPSSSFNGTATADTTATTAKDVSSVNSPSTVTRNAIAYNYLLAASWHPKSRHRPQAQALQHQQDQLQQQRQDLEDAAKAERTLRWKQKLRAAHPGKVDAGEDAFFHVSTPSRVALGVADGVGGWSEMGVDPALFSWALMNNAENIAQLTDTTPPEEPSALTAGGERTVLDAQTILDGAYSELVQSGTVEAGSSTACILSLCKMTGTLKASNLGDSSFLLIRDNQCIYESPSQQHFWNCPYQLTVLPPKLRQQQQQQKQQQTQANGNAQEPAESRETKKIKTKSYVQDLPKDAMQTTHQLQDGDVIVLATDGFWDNVFTKEALELVNRELGDIIREQRHRHDAEDEFKRDEQPKLSAEEILARVRALSKRLTNTARRFSLDPKRMTPFSQGARHIKCGGKIDDITVIVTLVRSSLP